MMAEDIGLLDEELLTRVLATLMPEIDQAIDQIADLDSPAQVLFFACGWQCGRESV